LGLHPFSATVSDQETALAQTVRTAKRAGYPIKVALIGGPTDLGAVPQLFAKPQLYARFLGVELTFLYKGRLLVVMPNGFGVYHYQHRTARERRALSNIPIGQGVDGLAASATEAVRRLAATNGLRLPEVAIPERHSSRRRGWVVIPFAALASGALIGLILIVRKTGVGAPRMISTRIESVPVPRFRYVVCDVFTDRPLAGNQLAVFTDAREIPEELLQPLAREMAFSETVFVFSPDQGGHVRLRIFTPAVEVRFAGHPVLGSAFVLGGPLQVEVIRLETDAGIVPVRLEREGARIDFGRMEQPLPAIQRYEPTAELLAALGVSQSELPVELYDNGLPHVFVVLGSPDDVAALRPDLDALSSLPPALGVNCAAGDGRRWKTRMFAPGGGVPEDPATGSAAGPLAVHLARHGLIAFGDEIEISQGVEIGRPSTLYATAWGGPEVVERVEVGGRAIVVARGEFQL
jgi:trans-2,3-dihydro-3-hydroxyanthranilate isomerase